MAGRRELSLVDELLERQVLDREARPVGRGDGVEVADDGRVVALAMGGTALAGRIGGPLGRVWAAAYRRLHDERERTFIRVPLERVLRVDSRVDLDVGRDDLGVGRIDGWINEHVIERIPGHEYVGE